MAALGAGAAFPHVEVRTIPDQGKTFEYQLTGPAVQALLGASVDIAYGFSVFAEYKANYSWNDADLDRRRHAGDRRADAPIRRWRQHLASASGRNTEPAGLPAPVSTGRASACYG